MRQGNLGSGFKYTVVSIHASRVGCDAAFRVRLSFHFRFNPRIPCGMRPQLADPSETSLPFQSTHPVWDATVAVGVRFFRKIVSIHASRVGCDHGAPPVAAGIDGFNPRIPCGMRPQDRDRRCPETVFQSTHPVWDATREGRVKTMTERVSIHASRVGCDLLQPFVGHGRDGFNPRIPCGMRQNP